MSQWHPFPHDPAKFHYDEKALKSNWAALHAGDCEPFPEAARIEALIAAHPKAAPDDFDGDTGKLAEQLQDAWRSFHRGDFGAAIEAADAIGVLAHAPANKAAGIYAHYLEPDESVAQKLYLAAAERAEVATRRLPEDANAWYFHAFNLGRYSQAISIVTALRQGIGGKIQDSLNRALELQPEHAEAHTAMGLYHAEIVDKIGKMIGSMTYGASADTAVEHFERAIALVPESPIAHMEYGNGLYMLHGDKALDQVTDLYVKASELSARDAMEALDIASASAELE